MFVYEHNKHGKLINLHIESWVPGMFFKNGKLFKLREDPRKLEIPEPKIELIPTAKTPKQEQVVQTSANKGIKSVSRKNTKFEPVKSKAKKRYQCKRKNSFSREQILSSLEPGAPQRITVENGNKFLWIQRPKVKKQLRGFCLFDVGAEFSMILHVKNSGKLYGWLSPGVTYNAKEETADFVIEFKEKENKKEK